jgi:hypothetical protein
VDCFYIDCVLVVLQSYGTTLERNIKALNMSTKGITFGLESFMSEKVREDSLMLWQLLTRSGEIFFVCLFSLMLSLVS